MLRVASINLNKRLGNPKPRERFVQWLRAESVQLVLAQEPCVASSEPPDLPGMLSVGGSTKVFAWIDSRLQRPPHLQIHEYCHRVECGFLAIYSAYLDAYKQQTRAAQLGSISTAVQVERLRPTLVVGDFNIGPTADDGVVDGRPSQFNGPVDREPLASLINNNYLVDRTDDSASCRWTIERRIGSRLSQFRCDLALISDVIAPDISVRLDHSVRKGPQAFTDHSALIIDVPVTVPPSVDQQDLFSDTTAPQVLFAPHKTAMSRRAESPLARQVVQRLRHAIQIDRILDYGCGRGDDVHFYRRSGLIAEGFDPHEGFGWTDQPSGSFGLVTLLFVLNVLPDAWERLKVLEATTRFISPHGALLVATRSPEEISQHATRRQWRSHNDGYISHEGKQTFQKGISRHEILRMAERVGLRLHPSVDALSATTEAVLLTK